MAFPDPQQFRLAVTGRTESGDAGGMSAWGQAISDAGWLTPPEVVHHAKRTVCAADTSIYCGADTGFGAPINMQRTVADFIKAGIAGIHIKDQCAPKKSGGVAGRPSVTTTTTTSSANTADDAARELMWPLTAARRIPVRQMTRQVRAQYLAASRPSAIESVQPQDQVVTGIVQHGDARGRLLGFPTANLTMETSAHLDGVWSAVVVTEDDGRHWPAAVSVGRRTTFYGRHGQRLLEAHLLDVEIDLYDRQISVHLVTRLRPQRRFRDVEDLVEQLATDVEDVRKWATSTSPEAGAR
ncbi:riboflavin kinase [Streptomyces sp. NBC_01446]|uniref:riboflavin kinase n=1 Tax=Streptomyces sp. NBC_01446 TaxID=2903870 RepID=UPI00225C2E23|nr:riboflavin kinase [Streptomyces sp. NBC_01446]MCX4641765.1 isocitrate lyase/phosphoenolpyruvate mutase family protein [Streptomyces sp. NBC_01446]